MNTVKSEPAAVTVRKAFLVIQAELMKYNAEYWIVWDTERTFNVIDAGKMQCQINGKLDNLCRNYHLFYL